MRACWRTGKFLKEFWLFPLSISKPGGAQFRCQPLETSAMPSVKPVPDPDLSQIERDCTVGRSQQSEYIVKLLYDPFKWLSAALKRKIGLGVSRPAN